MIKLTGEIETPARCTEDILHCEEDAGDAVAGGSGNSREEEHFA